MRYLIAMLVLVGCGTMTEPDPQLSEQVDDPPATGSITIVVCLDGICPSDTVPPPPKDTLGGCW